MPTCTIRRDKRRAVIARRKTNYIRAASKAILKVASKMGISTIQSYRGAQIFEVIGLSNDVVDRYFTKTASRIKGIGMDVIVRECQIRHCRGFPPIAVDSDTLANDGNDQWRRNGAI